MRRTLQIENKELNKGVVNTIHFPTNNSVYLFVYTNYFSRYLSIPISKNKFIILERTEASHNTHDFSV